VLDHPFVFVVRDRSLDVFEAYRTEPVPLGAEEADALAEAEIVTFTSSSTVTNFLRAIGDRPVPPVVAAIGPVTAATAREYGLTVDVEAEVHTVAGLVDALVAWAEAHAT
jgi:uroporphyrinogen-III synthase